MILNAKISKVFIAILRFFLNSWGHENAATVSWKWPARKKKRALKRGNQFVLKSALEWRHFHTRAQRSEQQLWETRLPSVNTNVPSLLQKVISASIPACLARECVFRPERHPRLSSPNNGVRFPNGTWISTLGTIGTLQTCKSENTGKGAWSELQIQRNGGLNDAGYHRNLMSRLLSPELIIVINVCLWGHNYLEEQPPITNQLFHISLFATFVL